MKYKFIINFKIYKEAICENAIKIAKICKKLEKRAKKKNVEIILAVVATDIKDIVKTKVKTYSQHIDNFDFGSHTGFIIPSLIKFVGVKGSLINHSEHRIDFKKIEENIKALGKIKLESCVCAENSKEVKKIVKFKPDFIAIEPRELIGGNISISTAKPELIKNSLKVAKKIPLLVGAGIKNKNDVKKAIEFGASGILVASGIVKAKNIEKAILDLLEGF